MQKEALNVKWALINSSANFLMISCRKF